MRTEINGFLEWNNAILALQLKIESKLIAIDKAPLQADTKTYVVNAMVIPMIKFQFNCLDINLKTLKEWSKKINKYLRKWWGFPTLANDIIHTNMENEGLNVSYLPELYNTHKISNIATLLNTKRVQMSNITFNRIVQECIDKEMPTSQKNLIHTKYIEKKNLTDVEIIANNAYKYKVKITTSFEREYTCICWNKRGLSNPEATQKCQTCPRLYHKECVEYKDNSCDICKAEMIEGSKTLQIEKDEEIIQNDIDGEIQWRTKIPEWEADKIWETRNHPHKLKNAANGNWYFKQETPNIDAEYIDIFEVFEKQKCKYTISAEICEIIEILKDDTRPIHILVLSMFVGKAITQWLKRWVYNYERNSTNKTPLWWQAMYEIYQIMNKRIFRVTIGKSTHKIEELEKYTKTIKNDIFEYEPFTILINEKVINSKDIEHMLTNENKLMFAREVREKTQGKINNKGIAKWNTSYWRNNNIKFSYKKCHFAARRKLWSTNLNMFRYVKRETPYCDTCPDKIKDEYHILNVCPRTKGIRMRKLDTIVLYILEWLKKRNKISENGNKETYINKSIEIAEMDAICVQILQ